MLNGLFVGRKLGCTPLLFDRHGNPKRLFQTMTSLDEKQLAKKARAWTKLNTKKYAPKRSFSYGSQGAAEMPREHVRKVSRLCACVCLIVFGSMHVCISVYVCVCFV